MIIKVEIVGRDVVFKIHSSNNFDEVLKPLIFAGYDLLLEKEFKDEAEQDE